MATSTSVGAIARILNRARLFASGCVARLRQPANRKADVADTAEGYSEEIQIGGNDGEPPVLASRAVESATGVTIELELRRLKVDQLLIVDREGRIHSDKAPFATSAREPLVSFTRSIDGGLTVYAGVPASNKTFCGSGLQPGSQYLQSGDVQPLRYDGIVLNSGDWISLAHGVFIPIPGAEVPDSDDPGLRLARRLAVARRGERVYLGRLTEPGCPEYVSRVHVTAHILSRIERKDGTFWLQVRIIRGVAAGRHVALIGVGGREQPIWGSLRLQPGARIALGDGLGDIVLPPMDDSPEKRIAELYSAIAGDSEQGSDDALPLFDNERDRVRMLEYHIKEGLLLVSRHMPPEAVGHFLRADPVRALGVSLSEGNLVFLKEISPPAVAASLDRIRAGTMYNPENRYIIVGRGVLAPGMAARDADEERLLAEWYRGIATAYASVFVKALKQISGKISWISLRGELIASQSLGQELDIAAYIEEHGVWLDRSSFADSQLDLLEGIERLRGYQLLNEQERFSKQLRRLSFDTALVIGRRDNGDREGEGPYFFGISPDVGLDEARGGLERLYRRRNALRLLRERELSVRKCTDGSYLLTPLPESAVFVPDTSGRYQRLVQPRHVPPQTPISLGGAYILVIE